MRKVTVYRYFTFISNEASARAPRAATLAAIERLGGVPLLQTARDVDAGNVDEDGFERAADLA